MANRNDLIKAMAKRTKFTQRESAEALEAALDSISEFLALGESVQLMGFGNFEVRDRAARNGHNPHTGEKMIIPKYRLPVFKAGKKLKDMVR